MTYGPTDRAVKLRHLLTPEDVEAIVDALEVDDLFICDAQEMDAYCGGADPVPLTRTKAALCGGTEQDYET